MDATFGTPAFSGVVNRSRVDGVGLVTGQVGYSWNNVLLYVKGGAAVTSARYDKSTTLPVGAFTANVSETRWGASAGVGLEFGFSGNSSVGVGYDHLFMGARDLRTTFFSGPALAPSFAVDPLLGTQSIRMRGDADLIAVRMSYWFGGPVAAKD